MDKITLEDLQILKSEDWTQREDSKGNLISNETMIETLNKPLDEINKNDGDLMFLGTWLKKIKENRNQKFQNFIWNKDKLIKNKVFPIDYEGNVFYYGLLLPKEVDNEINKKIVGKRQGLFPCLIDSRRNLTEINLRSKEDLKIDFETIPSYLPQRWDLEKIRLYLNGEDKKVLGIELLEKIKATYESYQYLRNKTWYDVLSLWDIGTYFYQIFEAYPLFEKRGLMGTGKTKSMTISSFISFNGGQIMVNPTEATLFRETEEVKGSKYFDEAEKLWIYNKATKQYEGDVRTELINASYTKEAKVPRQEKIGNRFITKWYSPYSPTQLSSINGLFGATENRAITMICTKSPNNDNRGEKEPTEDRNEPIWAEIRDECYRFALENWKEIKEIYNNFPKDCELKRRDLQIWKPLLAIAKFINENVYAEVLKFAIELSEMKRDEQLSEGSFDFMILSALKETMLIYQNSDKIFIDKIKGAYCRQRGDEETKTDFSLSRNISQHLKKIGFEKGRDGNGTYIIANKTLFDEIVSPICPPLAFLSSSPTLSTQTSINDNKSSVDGVKISEDKVIEQKLLCEDSEANVDNEASCKDEDKPERLLLQALTILQEETGQLIPKSKILELGGFEPIEELLNKLEKTGEICKPKPDFYQII